MAGESLSIGDHICLYSEENFGYVYAIQSSSVHSEVAVHLKQNREKPDIPDPSVITFEVCVANRYKLNKKLRKLETKSSSHPDNLRLKSQVAQAEISAEAENEDNETEQKRQRGKKVLYGQIIQLRHVFTSKYLHVSTTQTSRTETSNMQVDLERYNSKHAQFKIMPRYKVKAEGDVVQQDDQVVLESVKSPGQYLRVSKAAYGSASIYQQSHELNLSVRQSGFTIYRRYKPEKEHENYVKAGVPIRLFHKEIEAYLVAEGLFDDETSEDVHLRVRGLDQNNPKTLYQSTSAITYWHIEMQDGALNGNVVKWEQQCRLRHLTTRLYMKVEGKKVTLTRDHDDPKTVFRMHPVIKEKDEIEFETYCRLEHVVTATWLHALQDEFKRQRYNESTDDMSMSNLQWTTAPLKQISVSGEMQYDDAFTLQKVEPEHVENFYYMAGMVPFIQKIIKDKKAGQILNMKQAHEMVEALTELKKFMLVEGTPNKNRQKLLRNLRIVELLVNILKLPYRGSPDKQHMTKILVESYDVLYTYLMGDSRKNELYIAKHIDFFESQIATEVIRIHGFDGEGEIGLNAAHMVMELVKDNRKIVDRITHSHIDKFVDLLNKNKNYRYLDLLSVLCVCDGVAIPDNQKYITEKWLMSGQKNCVYHTELGEAIEKEAGIVYVSKDSRRTWIKLNDFVVRFVNNQQDVEGSKNKKDEEFLFLDHQLDLFGKLCYGRNDFAINVITEQLGYLTWKEAFTCLASNDLPDQLRAKYCSLIIGLFVDVGENTSVLDRITLTFIYDEIGAVGKTSEDMAEEEARERSVTKKYFPHLRDWISEFLDNNKDMTASLIGHNMLVEQVLRLVHYLVKYGYYGDLEDIKQLLGPMLDLVDGRNDKPYPIANGEVKTVWEKYRKEGRYKPGQEAAAIVNAKYQAMEVIDLFFNFRFNTRLERFIEEFKATYNKAHHGTIEAVGNVELAPLLREEYDIEDSSSTNHSAVKLLKHIFEESAYFKAYDLTDILMDLAHYEYDKMVVSSMSLMNRYYSAHDNLFKRAVQAQVLITDKSCEVLKTLHHILPVMTRLKGAKMTDEQTSTMTEIIDRLIVFCHLENEPEEEHPMNQSILYNHDILNIVFDILSQDIDVKLMMDSYPDLDLVTPNFAQYKGIKKIFEKSFILLKALARNNDMVQQRLFDRLDMLLNIQGAEQQMAECLTEVFTGNKQTCMKVMSYQVQRITALAAQHTNKAPQFLEVLDALVKVEELNLPLKRNQGYVMKYFMQYRIDLAYVIDQPAEKRRALLKGGDSPDLEYLMALVDLLATCAEGENRFIESICQTIFSVSELLEILNDPNIDTNLKRPFLRFLLWVYMNTASGMIESGAGDLPHDHNMWKYLTDLCGDLKSLSIYSKSNPETVKQLLKKPPKKSDKNGSPLIAGIMDSPDTLNSLLRSSAENEISEHGKGDWKLYHGSLHYMLEAVLPFLQIFFKNYYQIDTENYKSEADNVDELAKALVEFTSAVGNLISNQTYMKTMVSSMNVILSASTLPVNVMEEFQSQFGGGVSNQDIRSDARKRYDEYYEREEELNSQLNVFAINYSVAYGGLNDVRVQIGYSIEREYTEIDGDEELPLGEEFQAHVKQFVREDKRKPKDKYKLVGKLVDQLAISGEMTRMNEKERLNQEVLDIKCLQLLRAIVHNNAVKLPDDWEGDMKGNRKILSKIAESQNALNEHGGVLKVLDHLGRNSDNIVREVLAFTAAMLFGGNEGVQTSLEDYFLGTREEKFFFAIKNRMNLSAIATKEKRTLMAQHQAKIEEAIEQAKALQKAMLTGKMAETEIMQANQMGSMLMVSRASFGGRTPRGAKGRSQGLKARYAKHSGMGSRRSLNGSNVDFKDGARGGLMLTPRDKLSPSTSKGDKSSTIEMTGLKKPHGSRFLERDNKVAPMEGPQIHIEAMDEKELEEMAFLSSMDNPDDLDYHDDGYLQLVLRVLGLMCDGQNTTLQNYLREQPDNIKSVNLVAETSKFLALLYGSINKKTIALVTELFQSLIEFVSGNAGNQGVVFDNKICDYINHILRGASFQGCNLKEIMELKMSIATLINCMIEENPQIEKSGKTQAAHMKANVSKEVVEALDPESIWMVALDCYNRAMTKNDALKQVSEEREDVLMVGFKYYHVLMRMIDLVGEKQIRKDKLWKAHEGSNAAWPYYESGTLSVEILKQDVLQKVYFRCKDKSVLREDVKEKFKYEVDRSTPSNKLREFMDWSIDIINDIKYTRKVFSNPLSRFFVKYWWHFNMAMIFLSFVFFVLIMISWKEPTITDASGTSTPLLNSSVPDYNFNANNVIITTYVLGGIHNLFTLCVLISYFITNHPSLPKFRAIRKRFSRKSEDDDDDDDKDRESHLEEKIFSFNTCWYIILFASSILGTIFYGYFFSLHLLHMANFNQLLKRAIQAVTKNGASLLWVLFYGILFVWIYSLISFAFYRELYNTAEGIYCQTMYECFVTTLHRGLVLTLHEFLIVPDGKPFLYHLHKAVFDLTFFILITTIGLNIIFGIIVDTFSELRDNKWNVDNDMHSTCFICSRGSYDFEHQGGGFENHVKKEHNQWAYLFFFIHLDETRVNDYTALELYVYRLLQRENYDFFPLNRALTLQHEEDSNEVKLETLMGQVTYLVKKMKDDEATKERVEERRKQLEWEKKHKGSKM